MHTPRGFSIVYSNSEKHPCWIVMKFGTILHTCSTLWAACDWLDKHLRKGE